MNDSIHFKHIILEGYTPYQTMWDRQLTEVIDVLESKQDNTIYYLEHEPIYTIGRTRDQSSMRNTAALPHPFIEINRGGQGTFHGPGQLVGYPLVDLRPLGKDLHAYIRALEEALIRTSLDFGVKAQRRDGLTGVWVEDRKMASIGVGVKKWIAMHGFAINITKECLPPFFAITPCGIDSVEMTCLSNEVNKEISVKEFAQVSQAHLVTCLLSLSDTESAH